MRVQIAHVPGCPNVILARDRVAHALDHAGREAVVTEVEVATEEEARAVGMRGSPTILMDGVDPFPAAGSASLSCRLYPTGDGLDGAPSVAALMSAITRHDEDTDADHDRP